MKLIYKDAVVAEIEKRIKTLNEILIKRPISSLTLEKLIEENKKVLSILERLEVKEVDLEKDYKHKLMQKCVHKAYKRGYDVGVLKTLEKIHKDVDVDKLCKLRENIGFEFPAIASEYKKRLICYRQGIEDVIKAQEGE